MKKSLLALAAGSFSLGSAEFAMMGILPEAATGLGISVPAAGNLISAYAIGVCVGTLFLIFGRRISPKRLLLLFAVLMIVGNAGVAFATSAQSAIVARFVSGLPHGAFFGVATIVARRLAEPGREGRAVSIMVLGQTLANMLGVPGSTLVAGLFSWRTAFAIIALWSVFAFFLMARLTPAMEAIPDAGLKGQFRFLKRPGPWLVIGAVLMGNTGIFCWWSYVSPWLTEVGCWSQDALPALLMLAGAAMVAGSVFGGRFADRSSSGKAAALGQCISGVALLLIFFLSGSPATSAALMVLCAFGMFFISSPQQLLIVELGEGGGEMIGSACVQVAYNGGNAIGALIGQAVLNTGASYAWPGLSGVAFSCVAVGLLVAFFLVFEPFYRARKTACSQAKTSVGIGFAQQATEQG